VTTPAIKIETIRITMRNRFAKQNLRLLLDLLVVL
jgi:hypothetical protein